MSGGKEKTAINLGIINNSGVYFNNTFLGVFTYCSESQLVRVTTKYIALELEKIQKIQDELARAEQLARIFLFFEAALKDNFDEPTMNSILELLTPQVEKSLKEFKPRKDDFNIKQSIHFPFKYPAVSEDNTIPKLFLFGNAFDGFFLRSTLHKLIHYKGSRLLETINATCTRKTRLSQK